MDIANVRLQEATSTENGYIRFDIINEDIFEGGVLGATQDANTVMIKFNQNEFVNYNIKLSTYNHKQIDH